MQEDGIIRSIQELADSASWEAGKALFENAGVLKVEYTAKAVSALVANENYAFERVSINFRPSKIVCKCTCSHFGDYCKHILAVLLYIARETPELLNCLPNLDKNTAVPPAEEPAVPNNFPIAGPSINAETIHAFLSSDAHSATLSLHCPTDLPQLTLEKQRVTFTAQINFDGTPYAQGNIRKLIETGEGAGGMRLSDFDPQAQQVMRFLLLHAQFSPKALSLDSMACADLFHSLRGSSILGTPAGIIQFHLKPLEVKYAITMQPDGKNGKVAPALVVPERGALPPEHLTFVAGRGGYWIGRGLEYWWFPGILPFNWLRLIIQGQPLMLSSSEIDRLVYLCSAKRFPGAIEKSEATEQFSVEQGKVKPVLTLDWDSKGLVGDLQFDYGGRRVEVDGDLTLWSGEAYIRRDTETEKKAMETLSKAGFHQCDDTWHGIRLEAKSAIWQFIQNITPTLTKDWIMLWTPQVRLNIMATTEAKMSLQAGEHGNGWFETTCDLKSADGTPIPFHLALEAVKKDDDYIRLPSGAVVHLPASVLQLIRALYKRAEERHENRFSLNQCHAVALVDDMNPYWTGVKPDWYFLKERLLHPSGGEERILPNGLQTVLRDYQKEGVKWLSILEEAGFHGVLADEMGLGKTVQALATLAFRKAAGYQEGPSILVCPTSLLENWRAEAMRFTPELKVITISGAERVKYFPRIQDYDLAITSYALLRRDCLEYEELHFDYAILDEAQHIKNPKTANSQACKELKADHRLVLTGTPMENSPSEIWSIFEFLQPGYLGNQRDFRANFEAKHDVGKQEQMAHKLAGLIRPFILRRTKSEVCAELPPKLEQELFCEMGEEQRRLYDSLLLASRSFLEKIHSNGMNLNEQRMEMLSMILRLRQACCHPGLLPKELLQGYPKEMPSVKMELAKEVILEAIDSGHRILFFSQFTSLLKLFPKWLNESHIPYEIIDGSTQDRQAKVDRFNSDNSIPVFLLSLKAGGVGLNLPGADTVIHYDQWWNPMVEDQATDRSHRIGQHRTVTSIRLVTRNTIEEKILKLQDSKRELFHQVLGDAPASLKDITQEDIDFLLE